MYKVTGPGFEHMGLERLQAVYMATQLSKKYGKAHKIQVIKMTPGELQRFNK